MPTKFYDFRKIDSLGAVFNMIVGARGVGKTYGASVKAIKRAITKGEEFIYLRRYDEDMKIAKMTFFDEVMVEFPEWEFRVNGRLAEASPISAREDKKRHWTRIGFFIPLSKLQAIKSVPYARVRTMIYDEFIAEEGVNYLPDEATVFQNFYNTVDRYRGRVTCYLLANSVSIANPYFVKWKIKVPKDTEIVRYGVPTNRFGPVDDKRPFIAVHFPKSEDFASEVAKTRFGRFLLENDPAYVDYAMNNQFSDNHEELIKEKDPDAVYRFTLFTAQGEIAIWHSLTTKMYYATSRRPKDHENTFTTELSLMAVGRPHLERGDPLMSRLRTAWRHGRVMFDSPETRNAYLETFK